MSPIEHEQAMSGIPTHYGRVIFEGGTYTPRGGSRNWKVHPIPGFGLEVGPPLAQIRIEFDAAIKTTYIVLLSAERTRASGMLSANYGDVTETGFVVHLFEPVATRTLQNGSFSFAVIATV